MSEEVHEEIFSEEIQNWKNKDKELKERSDNIFKRFERISKKQEENLKDFSTLIDKFDELLEGTPIVIIFGVNI